MTAVLGWMGSFLTGWILLSAPLGVISAQLDFARGRALDLRRHARRGLKAGAALQVGLYGGMVVLYAFGGVEVAFTLLVLGYCVLAWRRLMRRTRQPQWTEDQLR